MLNGFMHFADISMLWVLVGAASSFVMFLGYKKYKESQTVGKLLNNIRKISESAGFSKLQKDEIWFIEDFLTDNLLFSSTDLVGFKAISGFIKKSGDADIYLALVRREFRSDPTEKAVVDYTYHFFLFSNVDNSTTSPLIFHRKNGKFNNPLVGGEISVENSINGFNENFSVRSLDIRLENIDIIHEIQEILQRYQSDYPFKYSDNDELSCLFISKKGITVIAPVTPNENDLMSIFELGAELTEFYKTGR